MQAELPGASSEIEPNTLTVLAREADEPVDEIGSSTREGASPGVEDAPHSIAIAPIATDVDRPDALDDIEMLSPIATPQREEMVPWVEDLPEAELWPLAPSDLVSELLGKPVDDPSTESAFSAPFAPHVRPDDAGSPEGSSSTPLASALEDRASPGPPAPIEHEYSSPTLRKGEQASALSHDPDDWFGELSSRSSDPTGDAMENAPTISDDEVSGRGSGSESEHDPWNALSWGDRPDECFESVAPPSEEALRLGEALDALEQLAHLPGQVGGLPVVASRSPLVEPTAVPPSPPVRAFARTMPSGIDAVADLDDSVDVEHLEPMGDGAADAATRLERLARRVRAGDLAIEGIVSGSRDEVVLASLLASLLRQR